MIDNATRDKLLHHYPLLRELSGETLATLVAGATLMPVPAGTTMFDEQQDCMGFAFLVGGRGEGRQGRAQRTGASPLRRDAR